MIKTYKILSLLLSYPNQELQKFLNDVDLELRNEAILSVEICDELNEFVCNFREISITEWQAHYVQLFDYSKQTSLYLFEHIKGDSKDRGQAMVDLLSVYSDNGFQLSDKELPDYLPVFLEFLSLLDIEKAAEMISEISHILNHLYKVFNEKNIYYKFIFKALLSLVDKNSVTEKWENIIKHHKTIDEEYEEEPVNFGTPNSCFTK